MLLQVFYKTKEFQDFYNEKVTHNNMEKWDKMCHFAFPKVNTVNLFPQSKRLFS